MGNWAGRPRSSAEEHAGSAGRLSVGNACGRLACEKESFKKIFGTTDFVCKSFHKRKD